MIKRAILLATEAFPAAALAEFAGVVEAAGYDSLWLPEAFGREPFATISHLLARTRSLRMATGVANVYARDPWSMAQSRRTLAELSGGRFMLALGVSNAEFNDRRGHAWEPPRRKLEAYLDAMDHADIRSPEPPDLGPRYLAAHGPALQSLAAARADGVVTYLMPVEHALASRARIGPDTELNVVMPFLAEPDPAEARRTIRRHLAYYVTLDYYQREWRKFGFGDSDFGSGGSDRLVDGIAAWGDASALAARIEALAEAGVSRVVIMPLDAQASGRPDAPTLQALAPSGS